MLCEEDGEGQADYQLSGQDHLFSAINTLGLEKSSDITRVISTEHSLLFCSPSCDEIYVYPM